MLTLASHAFATPFAPTTYDDDGDCYFTNVSPETLWPLGRDLRGAGCWDDGGYGLYDDATKPAGIFALQRRRKWAPALNLYVWNWAFIRVNEDDLQHRRVVDLDLGPGNGGRTSPIKTMYATSNGGAFWDGEVSW